MMHKRMYLAAMLVASVALLMSCTDVVGAGRVDVKMDSGVPFDGFVPPNDGYQPPQDSGPSQDVTQPQNCYSDEPGEFGYPCTELDDCNSGWCVPTKDGKRCTRTCEAECPCDWNCRPMGGAVDPVFLCVPRWLYLCDPCNDTSDCRFDEGDDGHYCLDHGAEGKFCGGECESDGKCPYGYECQSVPIPGGQVKPQCVPAGGATCQCSPLAIEWQKSTTCALGNEFGTCSGGRVCTGTGLSPCDAIAPAEETCDAVDNDCDGVTDDLPSDYQCPIENEFGLCMGKGKCILGIEDCVGEPASFEICDGKDNDCDGTTDNGFTDNDGDGLADECIDPDDDNDGVPDEVDNCQFVPNPGQENSDPDDQGDACDNDKDNDGCLDEEDCDPLNPQYCKYLTELCDGLDNDCNGLTDDNLCDDGNDCTIDSCNADGSCAHQPDNTALCDDGSVCTQVDKCVDGECKGLNEQICDDWNDCTVDSCDAVAGCLYQPTSSGPGTCEDGSLCTEESYCENGVCKGGPIKDCTGGNPCIFSQCNPDTDCSPPQYIDGVDCIHPSAGVCSKGQCSAGSCVLTPIAGAACTVPGGGQCSAGTCSGGQCTSNPGPCSKEACPPSMTLTCALCGDPVFQGTCASNGSCSIDTSGAGGFNCPGCSSFCIDLCGFNVCADFLFQ